MEGGENNVIEIIDRISKGITDTFAAFLLQDSEGSLVSKIAEAYNRIYRRGSQYLLMGIEGQDENVFIGGDDVFAHVNFKIRGKTYYDSRKITCSGAGAAGVEDVPENEKGNIIEVIDHYGNCFREACAINIFYQVFFHICGELKIETNIQEGIFKKTYNKNFKKEVIIPGYDLNQKFLIFLLTSTINQDDEGCVNLPSTFYEQMYNYIDYVILQSFKPIIATCESIRMTKQKVKNIMLSCYLKLTMSYKAPEYDTLVQHIDNIDSMLQGLSDEKDEALEKESAILSVMVKNLIRGKGYQRFEIEKDEDESIDLQSITNRKYIDKEDYLEGEALSNGKKLPVKVKIKQIKGKFYLYTNHKDSKDIKEAVFSLDSDEEIKALRERYEKLRPSEDKTITAEQEKAYKNLEREYPYYRQYNKSAENDQILKVFRGLEKKPEELSSVSECDESKEESFFSDEPDKPEKENPFLDDPANTSKLKEVFNELFQNPDLIHITQEQAKKVFSKETEKLSLLELRFRGKFREACKQQKLKTSEGKSFRSGDFFSLFKGNNKEEQKQNMNAYFEERFQERDRARDEVYKAMMEGIKGGVEEEVSLS